MFFPSLLALLMLIMCPLLIRFLSAMSCDCCCLEAGKGDMDCRLPLSILNYFCQLAAAVAVQGGKGDTDCKLPPSI